MALDLAKYSLLSSFFWNVVFYEQNTREDVNNDARPERPSTSTTDENIEAAKKIILDNLRITIREIADDVGILFDLCQAIFTGVLVMEHAAA